MTTQCRFATTTLPGLRWLDATTWHKLHQHAVLLAHPTQVLPTPATNISPAQAIHLVQSMELRTTSINTDLLRVLSSSTKTSLLIKVVSILIKPDKLSVEHPSWLSVGDQSMVWTTGFVSTPGMIPGETMELSRSRWAKLNNSLLHKLKFE